MSVTDNPERHCFELIEDGAVAFADYRRDGDRLVVPHVEAPDALRGTGAAGRLMEGVVEHARAEGISGIADSGIGLEAGLGETDIGPVQKGHDVHHQKDGHQPPVQLACLSRFCAWCTWFDRCWCMAAESMIFLVA